ncbi:gas vesicle protein GvpH [Haladaptatus sp. NG-WS-4]
MVARPCDRERITTSSSHSTDEDDDECAESGGKDDQSEQRDSEIDLGATIRSLTDLVNELTETEDASPDHGRRRQTEHGSETNATNTTNTTSATDRVNGYQVRTRRFESDVLVVADLPGVGVDDLFVGINDELPTLIVVVNGSIVEHVSLPENVTTVTGAKLKNGVLSVRIRAGDGDTTAL